MNRTRLIFFAIIIVALVVVGGSFLWQRGDTSATLSDGDHPKQLEVRVLTSLAVEPWVEDAAQKFNKENHKLNGVPVHVQIIAMDGLTALGKWDRDEFGTIGDKPRDQLTAEEKARLAQFPTAWIPDSRYLVELANATYKTRLGRDVFLTDGEYRARPIALSLFVWGIYESRAKVLLTHYSKLNWQVIHDAATAKGGWPELGGDPAWGYFKLVVPNPLRNVGGLAAMVAAAGEYYQRPSISVADVTKPDFQKWLAEIMYSVTNLGGGSSYTAEDFALFGYSVGDGGQLLESDLLQNMEGIKNRWGEPLRFMYPPYVTWFDFPFTIWMGSETTAQEKNAALLFEHYLISEPVQKLAVQRGLRPVNPSVSVTDGDTLFSRWQAQGVLPIVKRADAMRFPDRDILQALLRWFQLNVEGR